MPASKSRPASKTAAKRRKPTAALDGLEVSLDDAQKAIAELRKDLSTGGRKLLKDVEAGIKSARRDLRSTRKRIQSDLEDLGGAVTPRRTRPAAKRKPAAKRRVAKR